ncbi:MAG TPA: hypothetical protein VMB79_14185 [Jatrophihabitans sp.]|nr:hypothetical protein [Jatrophihabitans sp.]
MTETTQRVPPVRTSYQPPREPSGWTGWVIFAAVMMAIVGCFQIIEGLTALFRHSYYVVGHNDLLVRVNYTGWGWVHMALGVLLLAAGLSLLSGRMWARIVGVTVAGISAVVNLAFIAAYPVWSILVIAVDVIVIYAISVHGRELRT